MRPPFWRVFSLACGITLGLPKMVKFIILFNDFTGDSDNAGEVAWAMLLSIAFTMWIIDDVWHLVRIFKERQK